MAGAGLSTPSGIPDFRSPKSGLYSNLEKYNLPYPEAIFDLQYFQHNPQPFLDLAKEIWPGVGVYKPNIAHYFIRLLEDKGKLLRMYTQNIDGLERLSGLNEDRLVEAHGSFESASCILCLTSQDPDVVRLHVMRGVEPRCLRCNGLVKPDITFFGEQLPRRFAFLSETDTYKADFLLVIGTSLEVFPFASLAEMVPYKIPRLLINRESVGSFGSRGSDAILTGDIVEQITRLAEELGWLNDLNKLFENNQQRAK